MTIVEVIAMVICVFLNVLLETTIVVNINLWGILPDTIIVATTSIALVSGPFRGALYGGICGLVIDTLFGNMLGIYTLAYMVVGLLAGAVSNKYYSGNVVFAFIAAFAMYLLKEGFIIFTLKLQEYNFALGNVLLRFVLPAALSTGAIAIPVFYVYRRYRQYEIRRMKYR